MKQDEAAGIIQRWFRRYLRSNERTAGRASDVRIEAHPDKIGSLSCDEQLYAKRVLEEVNLFYRRLHLNRKKKEEIRQLCTNVDEISTNLRTMTKLEQCKESETSFCDNLGMERITERHREEIRRINLKWWEKLDIYESA